MIPDKLEDWTYEMIKELVDKNEGESDKHDFKYDIPNPERLTKICCAFANTKGGYVILGVKEDNSRFKIEGIDDDKELAHRFGQRIDASPTVYFSMPRILTIPDSDRIIAVFQIPQSPERPHLPSKEEHRIFWKRTNRGNDYMT